MTDLAIARAAVVEELKPAYFEKQVGYLCAIHALNNLFQRAEFDKAYFDTIATQVRYHSLALDLPMDEPIGRDYNVSTIEAALTNRNYQIERLRVGELEEASHKNSLPTGTYLVGNNAHWFGLRRFKDDGHLWYLNSQRDGPEVVLNLDFILRYMDATGVLVWCTVFRIVPDPQLNSTSDDAVVIMAQVT